MSPTSPCLGSKARQKLAAVALPSPGESMGRGLPHPFILSSSAGSGNADAHLLGVRFSFKISRATPAPAPVGSSLRSWAPFPCSPSHAHLHGASACFSPTDGCPCGRRDVHCESEPQLRPSIVTEVVKKMSASPGLVPPEAGLQTGSSARRFLGSSQRQVGFAVLN